MRGFEEWFSPLVRIVTRAVPALLLVPAAAGTACGSVVWAAVTGGLIALVGGPAILAAEGVVATTTLVIVTLALLAVVGAALARLLRPDGPGDVGTRRGTGA